MHSHHMLPAELTIYTISEAHAQCVGWLNELAPDEQDACLQVGAQAVAEVDAAGVQLLMSLSNALVVRRQWLRLVAPSKALVSACEALGATGLMHNAELEGVAQ